MSFNDTILQTLLTIFSRGLMKIYIFIVITSLLLTGCAKNPKIIEQENKAKLDSHLRMMDDTFSDLEKLFAKVDSLNQLNIKASEKFNPNVELFVYSAVLRKLDSAITASPITLEPSTLMKCVTASEFVNYSRRYFMFYEEVKNGESVKYLPREELEVLKGILNRYKIINEVSKSKPLDSIKSSK